MEEREREGEKGRKQGEQWQSKSKAVAEFGSGNCRTV